MPMIRVNSHFTIFVPTAFFSCHKLQWHLLEVNTLFTEMPMAVSFPQEPVGWGGVDCKISTVICFGGDRYRFPNQSD
jgi:hypothetical protein